MNDKLLKTSKILSLIATSFSLLVVAVLSIQSYNQNGYYDVALGLLITIPLYLSSRLITHYPEIIENYETGILNKNSFKTMTIIGVAIVILFSILSRGIMFPFFIPHLIVLYKRNIKLKKIKFKFK